MYQNLSSFTPPFLHSFLTLHTDLPLLLLHLFLVNLLICPLFTSSYLINSLSCNLPSSSILLLPPVLIYSSTTTLLSTTTSYADPPFVSPCAVPTLAVAAAKGVAVSTPGEFAPELRENVCFIVAAVLLNSEGHVLMMQEAKR